MRQLAVNGADLMDAGIPVGPRRRNTANTAYRRWRAAWPTAEALLEAATV